MVEQDLHAVPTSGGEGLVQAAFGVGEHAADLFSGDTREPLEEFVDTGSILEVLEQCSDGYPRPFEEPHPAYLAGNPLNGWAATPIKHASILRPRRVTIKVLPGRGHHASIADGSALR
jgi:hypothetical protein